MSTPMTIRVNILQRWLLAFEQPVKRGDWRRWRRILAALYIPVTAGGLYGYINGWSAALLIGILALYYTPGFDKQPNSSFRFGWPALLFAALYFFVAPLRTVVFAGLVFALCLYCESFFRRIERTTLFILALLTPIADYFANTFSFPIRMQLTTLAGGLMNAAGLTVTVAGNAITFHDHLFTVDPACMGLHMLIISLLTALLLMNYYQRKLGRRLPTIMIVLLLLVTIGLNIINNLIRIICLVILLILPDNPLHGILGLVFLCCYVLLPLLPMTRFIIRRCGHPVQANGSPSSVRCRRVLAGNIAVAAIVTGMVLLHLFRKTPDQPMTAGITIPGYTLQQRPNAILQLDNAQSLVYIKPIPGFYYTDHTPSICWQGSGYVFTTLSESSYAGVRIYEGVLEKGVEKLYTAWWYDNGIRQTIAPAEWRWDLIRGGQLYSVVNITAATPAQLRTEVTRVLKTHPFLPLLRHPFNSPG